LLDIADDLALAVLRIILAYCMRERERRNEDIGNDGLI
jgi:hypothetical protein